MVVRLASRAQVSAATPARERQGTGGSGGQPSAARRSDDEAAAVTQLARPICEDCRKRPAKAKTTGGWLCTACEHRRSRIARRMNLRPNLRAPKRAPVSAFPKGRRRPFAWPRRLLGDGHALERDDQAPRGNLIVKVGNDGVARCHAHMDPPVLDRDHVLQSMRADLRELNRNSPLDASLSVGVARRSPVTRQRATRPPSPASTVTLHVPLRRLPNPDYPS